MIDTSKQYTYNGKPVRIYADGSDTFGNQIHCGYYIAGLWTLVELDEQKLVEVLEQKEEGTSMTKEDILEAVALDVFSLEQILDEFFNSNVVIPRGVSRHTYADIIHAYAEGAEIQYKGINDMWSSPCTDFPKGLTYRIKPSEPVFEWQYDTKLNDGSWNYYKEGDKTHFTDEEIATSANWLSKVEHTKRVRQ